MALKNASKSTPKKSAKFDKKRSQESDAIEPAVLPTPSATFVF